MFMTDTTRAPYDETGRKAANKPHGFVRTSSAEILNANYPPVIWMVEGYVPEGLTILAGRQKIGKTWLALDWAIAVATGDLAMGSVPCEGGNVLYIDLENGRRRIQARLKVLLGTGGSDSELRRLEWTGEAPALGAAFIEDLDQWRRTVASPRLVVVDVFQRIKPAGHPSRNAYENDYAALAPLQKWATDNHIAVVLLHHTRKGGADDPLEALSGSNGLAACADTTVVLDKKSDHATLYVRGRDVEEKSMAMSFSEGKWTVAGEADVVTGSKERGNILTALRDSPEAMSPSELADVTGMKPGNVRKLLWAMVKSGEVLKTGRGRYVHPLSAPVPGQD
jgi:RecA-family ATPase